MSFSNQNGKYVGRTENLRFFAVYFFSSKVGKKGQILEIQVFLFKSSLRKYFNGAVKGKRNLLFPHYLQSNEPIS